MPNSNILLIVSEEQTGDLLKRGVLQPAGYQVTQVGEPTAAKSIIRSSPVDCIILESGVGGEDFKFVYDLLATFPATPLILIGPEKDTDQYVKLLRRGLLDFLTPPLKPDAVLESVQQGVDQSARLISWAKDQYRRDTDFLRQRVNVLETLGNVGRSVTASLDLDEVLKSVVDAAVEITGAEEGSLLILDESSGELTMRASLNFKDEFVKTFRLPISDTLAGEVVRTGKPVLLDEKSPQKIKTSYLVKTLIYVPLKIQDKVLGVLGVDNRESERPFQPQHISLVAALADYAAIAIENARLFENTEIARHKLEAILTRIEDGVIVVDPDGKVILVNRVARTLFGIDDDEMFMKPVEEVFNHEQLIDLLTNGHETFPFRCELELDEDKVINAQLNFVPDVGLTITMHDVTYFKELDRIKSEFVSTVSHDLRSPLTAILGYVELLERVGPVNDKQRSFIQRVQVSVRNITELINDLLDLGRIESGFDESKVSLSITNVVMYSIESLKDRILDSDVKLALDVPKDLPQIIGDSVRLRQVVDNLLGNALRYTPKGGKIEVELREENEQIIFQVCDNGVGIPAADRPHIFEKFYRASNVVENISGSGLGLAIVKTIVENHNGRIWVDSTEGEGSVFTIVLPIEKNQE
ncbi:MAG: GAF domain-containing protein [Anaerolineales bacterium]|nr:GAF domain-containing protein [Chloroflexota bacterium]MBL6980251.1 GAF domain-containing protein [Anaerolineales bacterium]